MSEKPKNLPEMPQLPEEDQDRALEETSANDLSSTRGLPATQPQPRLQQPRPRPPTQPQNTRSTLPPPPPTRMSQPPMQTGQTRPPYAQHMPQRGAARSRRDSGFYLPLWSLILMLFFVMAAAVGIVAVVVGLGNRTIRESEPIFVVITAVPTAGPAAIPISPATPTIPPALDPNLVISTSQAPLALAGPTLPPVVFTPTPRIITVGENVVVVGVRPDQLNVRDNPGITGTQVVFRATEGSLFNIVDGPRQADGLTWWRIQNPNNNSIVGWAASNYLEIAQRP